MVKNPPANQGIRSLVWEDPLEKEMETRSSILAGEPHRVWQATVHGVTKSQTWLSDWTTTSAKILNYIKDRQCSLTFHAHKHLVLCCWVGEISKWVHSWMSSEIIWTHRIMPHPSALLMFLCKRLFVLSAVDSLSLYLFITALGLPCCAWVFSSCSE